MAKRKSVKNRSKKNAKKSKCECNWNLLPPVVLRCIQNKLKDEGFGMYFTCKDWYNSLCPIKKPFYWNAKILICSIRLQFIGWFIDSEWINPSVALIIGCKLKKIRFLEILHSVLFNLQDKSEMKDIEIKLMEKFFYPQKRPKLKFQPLPQALHNSIGNALKLLREKKEKIKEFVPEPWIPFTGKIEQALYWSCEIGNFESIKFLREHCGLTLSHVRSRNNFALRSSVFKKEVKIVEYLITEIGITVDDLKCEKNYCLCISCEKNCLEMVRLLSKYLSIDDLKENQNEAFYLACSKESIDVVRYLSKILTYQDLFLHDNYVIKVSIWNGNLEILRELRGMGLNSEILEKDGYAILVSSRKHNINVLKWLLDEIQIKVDKNIVHHIRQFLGEDNYKIIEQSLNRQIDNNFIIQTNSSIDILLGRGPAGAVVRLF
jgi:hypothetical protein